MNHASRTYPTKIHKSGGNLDNGFVHNQRYSTFVGLLFRQFAEHMGLCMQVLEDNHKGM